MLLLAVAVADDAAADIAAADFVFILFYFYLDVEVVLVGSCYVVVVCRLFACLFIVFDSSCSCL